MTKNGGELKVYDKRTQKYTIIDDGSTWGKIQTPKMKLEVNKMTQDDKAAFKEFRNGVAFAIAIVGIGVLVVSMLSNHTPTDQPSFEVVDKYNECDVVRYAPQQTATYKYFLYCENNK